MGEVEGLPPMSKPYLTPPPANLSRKTGRSGNGGVEVSRTRGRFGVVEPVDPDLPVPTEAMPNKGKRVGRRRRLLRVAAEQAGLFTVAQAFDAGLDRRARHHHLTYGNWRRTEAPQVFRLTGWPPDRHERLRAWLLWAGPQALLTSWTALGLAGLAGSASAVPVDLEIPFRVDRAGRRRRHRLFRQLEDSGAAGSVRLHRAVTGAERTVDGLRFRPPAEAVCAAIDHGRSSVALALASELLDSGLVEPGELSIAARTVHCSQVTELLVCRLAGRRTATPAGSAPGSV